MSSAISTNLLLAALGGQLAPGLGPAHLERVHQARHLQALGARRQERALVLGEGAQRRGQHLAAEPLHPRLQHGTLVNTIYLFFIFI